MNNIDIKIFELIDLLISLGKIKYASEFCLAIGFVKQNIVRVKQGKAHFTAEHIKQMSKVYNVNANWIFGTQPNPFITNKVLKAIV